MKRVDLVYMGLLDDDFEANQIDFFNPVGPRDFDSDRTDLKEWAHSPFNTDDESTWASEPEYKPEDWEYSR